MGRQQLPDDAQRIAKELGEFALPFIRAIVKLRRAETEGRGTTLTAEEVKATLDAYRMLKERDPRVAGT